MLLVKMEATVLHPVCAHVTMGGWALRVKMVSSVQTMQNRLYFWSFLSLLGRTILWTFVNTLDDRNGTFLGTGYNSPTFTSGINGYGSAVVLNGSNSQCVYVSPFLNIVNISFTWEFWVYPILSTASSQLFIGHCEHNPNANQCVRFAMSGSIMYFTFWG